MSLKAQEMVTHSHHFLLYDWRQACGIGSTRASPSPECASPSLIAAPHSCRSAEARTAATGLQEDMGSMLGWLDKAEGVLAIPLQPAEPQHIRDTLGKVQVTTETWHGT